jgi:hypothetical protein
VRIRRADLGDVVLFGKRQRASAGGPTSETGIQDLDTSQQTVPHRKRECASAERMRPARERVWGDAQSTARDNPLGCHL